MGKLACLAKSLSVMPLWQSSEKTPYLKAFQRPEYPVYTLNERMILRFSTSLGPCLVVMVAGWGVGNITLPLAPAFRPCSQEAASKTWSPPIAVKRGDWVATFELGSTVVLITPPAANVSLLVSPNQKVKYGQPVLTYPG
jgi:phosphatidylserine decarboxylase